MAQGRAGQCQHPRRVGRRHAKRAWPWPTGNPQKWSNLAGTDRGDGRAYSLAPPRTPCAAFPGTSAWR
eukprot:scaffold145676_cov30-Tisochrysis_lutea.AAC.2